MDHQANETLAEVKSRFRFGGELASCAPYGSGHINSTYLAEARLPDGSAERYILQRINPFVFPNGRELMENIEGVTTHLLRKLREEGGDAERGTLRLVPADTGELHVTDRFGAYWRAYRFIEGTVSLNLPESDADFYQSAVAFGRFQKQLLDYPAQTLHETILDFHHTPKRLQALRAAVERDALGRAAGVQRELDFCFAREPFTRVLIDRHAAGELPLRVTHNDTKLNNVLLDRETRAAVCVIDLDTVMPGFSVTDFGDSIRFGASTAVEDEPDLSKVEMSLSRFTQYTEGFLAGSGGLLTDAELGLLPEGAKMMTLECGIRFLTDYLEGDRYFKIDFPEHNLVRCRTQLKLVEDMEKKWDAMKSAVETIRKKGKA